MILYHGSNTPVTKIDFNKCRPYKDFGQGFYSTDIREQAEQMAKRVVRLYGGSPHISEFYLDESIFNDSTVNIRTFDKPDKDWALFVLNNRNKRFKNIGDALCNQDNKYDVVLGPVANDDIAYLFRTFTHGLIDMDTLIQGLKYKSLTTQYSFHTEAVLKYLQSAEG